jgi:hypothetical protein
MGLKIGDNIYLMDIDENTQIVHQTNNSLTVTFPYMNEVLFLIRHEFGVLTILPTYHLYSLLWDVISTVGVRKSNDLFLKDYKVQLRIFVYFTLL